MRFASMGLCLVGLGISGCDAVKINGGCTLIGCSDQATIGIQKPNGAAPGLAVSLDIDGRKVECAAPVGTAGPSCDTQVRISSRELQICVEEVVGSVRTLRCTGTGRFEQVIDITGTPTIIAVTLRDGATVVAERTFQPQYTNVRPNGPDCEPVCRQWGQTWELP